MLVQGFLGAIVATHPAQTLQWGQNIYEIALYIPVHFHKIPSVLPKEESSENT
jgi:hypothetical protein